MNTFRWRLISAALVVLALWNVVQSELLRQSRERIEALTAQVRELADEQRINRDSLVGVREANLRQNSLLASMVTRIVACEDRIQILDAREAAHYQRLLRSPMFGD